MKIDLCCGGHAKEGFIGLDILEGGNTKIICDLNKGILPFEDDSIDEFYEQNSFYEIENPMQIIKECYRCLKVGGTLTFREMYFSSHYAYTPRTKNFWNFSSARLFTKGYRDNYGWKIESIDFDTNKVPKWVVNMNRNIYEKYFSRIMPITGITYKLKKVKKGE